jgi:hypothetical protein
VVALAWLLWGRLADQLDGEVDPATGMPRPAGSLPYGVEGFWQRGLGIVSPRQANGVIMRRRHNGSSESRRSEPGHRGAVAANADSRAAQREAHPPTGDAAAPPHSP